MELRGSKFSIYVTKYTAQIPNKVGVFGFYKENKIITSQDYIEFAIRWARLYLTKIKGSILEEVDKTLLTDRLTQITEKIKEFSRIRFHLTSIETSISSNIESIRTILDDIKAQIISLISDIETEIGKKVEEKEDSYETPTFETNHNYIDLSSDDEIPF